MRSVSLAVALWLWAMALPAGAQDLLRVVTEDPPPQGAQSAEVHAMSGREGASGRMTYAAEVSTDREDGPIAPRRGPRFDGSVSTLLVVAVVLGALVLLVWFGGSGALVQRRPEAARQSTASPEAWNITDVERAADTGDLLQQIASMPDRRAAVVRLLRHCLLRAADDCGTRFMRADTERAAFRRLPTSWARHGALGHILRDAELANYGGRPVDEARFTALLDLGRAILTGRGGSLA